MKIAVVDDDKVITDMLSDWIASLGHECAGFTEYETARRWVVSEAPDVIIVDYVLDNGHRGTEIADIHAGRSVIMSGYEDLVRVAQVSKRHTVITKPLFFTTIEYLLSGEQVAG